MTNESHVHHPNYVKIWAVLVALLVISVAGSLSSMRAVVLVAAFGVAIVKAYLVAKNFMHVTVEKRWVPYLLVAMIAFVVILFAGVAPDVMRHSGLHWSNDAAKQAVETGMKAATKHE
ncbi:MAG: cytochrome C oxidase subunit IV family protein [Acidobacteriia bacterium]|nr:cytochrome C oxidase subunit IV family protein [Terriglobia bacterium]